MGIGYLLLPAVIAGLVVTGAAQAQSTWSGSSSPEDLRYRLDVLDAELADIRARLGGTTGSVVAPAGPTGGGDYEQEIRRLTAQVEQMQNRLTLIQQDLNRRFGDIEFRLTELEGGDTSSISVPQVGGGAATNGGSVTAFPSQGQQVAAVSVSEQGDLDRAVEDVRQGRFDQAEDRLRRFIQGYPNSPLTGEAFYWLGESQSVRGIHADAAKSYLNGYQSDTRGPRAAHNLFRLGVTLGRLGQVNEACLTLREVRNQFPSAPDGLADRADSEADQLTCG